MYISEISQHDDLEYMLNSCSCNPIYRDMRPQMLPSAGQFQKQQMLAYAGHYSNKDTKYYTIL